MDTATLSSTFLLTLLLLVGLFFFIRAATKDRTQTAQLISEQDEAVFMPQLQAYFLSRAYRVIEIDQVQNRVVFEGYVQPSIFLAVFLTFLAAVGLVCLSLVLSFLFPQLSPIFLGLLILSPVSGMLYWQKAGRIETVLLQFEPKSNTQESLSRITVTAHRDELAELQKALPWKPSY
ncbi:cofactor assembly of complex C subunit B [Nostoc sp. CMAA1605]|uniref:cofactor assembly of complex C subunit B n=1 Tax=Nostoc sp. CMAA1605 TaxID=2055159 RepID=UPI001F3A3EC8|nr:cofactor assembly of complex C subunit B [Nostoc sp. CMAA1605]MCF4969527.1 cofactor assembly of complex C subunit B [Nostoc sp. CMAA1605]